MELKPCRDCGTFVPWTSRSCPHCGILNPVAKWVALPEGADETYREPVARPVETPAPSYPAAYASAAAAPGPYASAAGYAQAAPPVARPPAPRRAETPAGAPDPLADARKKVRECAIVYYLVAGMNLVASFFVGPVGVLAAAVLAGLATWLRMKESQVAAALLLVFSLLNIIFIIKNEQMPAVWPAFIMVVAAWRGLNAAMALQGCFSASSA